MNQERIGKFIAECRKNKNITQSELAEKLGVTNKSVSRWENGKNMPDYSILKDLCNILDVDVNELLSGEKDNKETIENLDMILKEYYKMKKRKDKLKAITIVGGSLLFLILPVIMTIIYLKVSFDNRLHITTNKTEYNNVIGKEAKGIYKDKWVFSEKIFPKTIEGKNVLDFKMICDDFIDNQYLSYLVIDYGIEDYNKEINRLKNIGIDEYIGYYGVEGFDDYELVSMESDQYYGFVYALTDGKSKIIYVELIFCNYTMDIDYKNEINEKYLPKGFDASEYNPYRMKLLNEGK